MITALGEAKYFPIAFGLVLITFFILLRRNKKNAARQGIPYMKSTALFFLNFVLAILIIESMKRFFSYQRPYCLADFAMNQELLSLGYYLEECNKSFPSGHATYISLFVVSFWSLLNKELKLAGVALIILVCLSRVVLAKHFMADVTYGSLIVFLIVNPINSFVVAKYFPKYKPVANKLLAKFV
jgi:membrane-associated phospholipid phosphatase